MHSLTFNCGFVCHRSRWLSKRSAVAIMSKVNPSVEERESYILKSNIAVLNYFANWSDKKVDFC